VIPRCVVGYRHWPGADCPHCHYDYMAIEDDGDPQSYLVRCWCGATARVLRDDAGLLEALLPADG
jgi:hypothetical protein